MCGGCNTPAEPSVFQRQCLDAHNAYRAQYGARAQTWDGNFATTAADRASEIASTGSSTATNKGENLGSTTGSVLCAETDFWEGACPESRIDPILLLSSERSSSSHRKKVYSLDCTRQPQCLALCNHNALRHLTIIMTYCANSFAHGRAFIRNSVVSATWYSWKAYQNFWVQKRSNHCLFRITSITSMKLVTGQAVADMWPNEVKLYAARSLEPSTPLSSCGRGQRR